MLLRIVNILYWSSLSIRNKQEQKLMLLKKSAPSVPLPSPYKLGVSELGLASVNAIYQNVQF